MNRTRVRQVLDCASPLALCCSSTHRKRQRAAAVQNAVAWKCGPPGFMVPRRDSEIVEASQEAGLVTIL
jgi:hypothetical protein